MIILKVIMDINLPSHAAGAGCREEAEAGLPGGGRGQDHPQGHHGCQLAQVLLIRCSALPGKTSLF